MMPFRLAALLLACAALAACHSQPTAGGLTADDERALDNAAAMLNDNAVFEVPADSLVANEGEIAAQENAAGTNRQ